jgi:ankyrin repeat protein
MSIRGVEEILKHYPDQINLKNGTHKTPLYFAALNGHADIVTYLLSQQVSYD